MKIEKAVLAVDVSDLVRRLEYDHGEAHWPLSGLADEYMLAAVEWAPEDGVVRFALIPKRPVDEVKS